MFKFNTKEDIENWQVNKDSGYELGHTKANFTLTKYNTGLFHGDLSTELNKAEKHNAMYSGYANVTSVMQYSTFGRELTYNWSGFNHFYLKVRGDGRTYNMILTTSAKYNESRNFVYFYPLYTRGGPYWQYVKIPFSKFVSGNRGRILDMQKRMHEMSVKRIGFSCMDNNDGPFALELDFIAVLRDDVAYEDSAYEAYQVPKYVAGV